MWLLYDLIIRFYGAAISLAAVFNPKAKAWVKGRRAAAPSLTPSPTWGRDGVGATAWFHCASLGEFEQGRPVIEAFRSAHPDWKIHLTFFSPSGYEIRKNYQGADSVSYLPLDTPGKARRFIAWLQPTIAVFVKYEFWFRLLDELDRNRIPVYVISASFRPNHHFFRWYGRWARKQLGKVTRFFVQDEQSAQLLRAQGIENLTVSGDTRFDRVSAVVASPKAFPPVEKFCGSAPVFLAGSTWPEDEALVIQLISKLGDRVKFIIAPHEVGGKRIEDLRSAIIGIKKELRTQNSEFNPIFFSQLTEENASSARVVIVDGIGYLSQLYQYATIAYIGGGFGAGIHNILEAAAFGKPVIFGPKYRKFREAVELIDNGGAFSIETIEQLYNRTVDMLDNRDSYILASDTCKNYVRNNCGATMIVLEGISKGIA